MRNLALYRTLQIVSYVVLALGAAAIAYAVYIGIAYWSGIGV